MKKQRLSDVDEMQEVNIEKLATENSNRKAELMMEERKQKLELK